MRSPFFVSSQQLSVASVFSDFSQTGEIGNNDGTLASIRVSNTLRRCQVRNRMQG